MTKTGLLKLIGLFLSPLFVIAVAVYLLYPYINEEKYQQVTEQYRRDIITAETDGDFETVSDEVKPADEDSPFQDIIDSLRLADEDIMQKLDQHLRAEMENGKIDDDNLRQRLQEQENFAEKVKTLLSLDEEELIPILNKLNDEQIIQLYKGGGTIQRRKILRSLKPDRAAKLITEIMQ